MRIKAGVLFIFIAICVVGCKSALVMSSECGDFIVIDANNTETDTVSIVDPETYKTHTWSIKKYLATEEKKEELEDYCDESLQNGVIRKFGKLKDSETLILMEERLMIGKNY